MTTLYVSPAGNDTTGTGSQSSPFRTIQKGAEMVNPGDTVIVKDGIYTTTSTVEEKEHLFYLDHGGTSSNPLIFKSEHRWGAVLDGLLAVHDGIRLDAASHVTVDGFELRNTIEHGILSYDSDNLVLKNMHIHNIGQNYTTWGEHSAYVGVSNNSLFDSNLFHHIGHLHRDPMVWTDYCCDHGYYLSGNDNSIINNIFYSMESGWSIPIDNANRWIISNNVMYGKNDYEKGGMIFVNDYGGIYDITAQNNIIFRLPSESGYYATSSGFDMWTTWNAADIRLFNNLVYRPDGKIDLVDQYSGDSNQWTASNNILHQDPMFVDPANGDFHLRSTSPAIGKGLMTNAPLYDFAGNPRIGRNDIGAFQYIGEIMETTMNIIVNQPKHIFNLILDITSEITVITKNNLGELIPEVTIFLDGIIVGATNQNGIYVLSNISYGEHILKGIK